MCLMNLNGCLEAFITTCGIYSGACAKDACADHQLGSSTSGQTLQVSNTSRQLSKSIQPVNVWRPRCWCPPSFQTGQHGIIIEVCIVLIALKYVCLYVMGCRVKPLHYISWLIGHEGAGSILSLLRKKWVWFSDHILRIKLISNESIWIKWINALHVKVLGSGSVWRKLRVGFRSEHHLLHLQRFNQSERRGLPELLPGLKT